MVDRLIVRSGIEKRLTDSIETAMSLGNGLMMVEPRSFSFNNPFGACPDCFGLGYKMEFDEDLMIPDKSLSINEGAITVLGWQSCTDKGSFSQGDSGCSGERISL